LQTRGQATANDLSLSTITNH